MTTWSWRPGTTRRLTAAIIGIVTAGALFGHPSYAQSPATIDFLMSLDDPLFASGVGLPTDSLVVVIGKPLGTVTSSDTLGCVIGSGVAVPMQPVVILLGPTFAHIVGPEARAVVLLVSALDVPEIPLPPGTRLTELQGMAPCTFNNAAYARFRAQVK